MAIIVYLSFQRALLYIMCGVFVNDMNACINWEWFLNLPLFLLLMENALFL